uniref:Small-subunit processome Utp12 domain-containing protein n=1 Tax=Peronospora matthiolae TaxID=2874970 RepID=A0AAV1V595_9STRA
MQLFADSQTHFAAVSEDGRLKLWNVASSSLQQELKERDHLSYSFTSLAWTCNPKSKSKKRGSGNDLGLVALGASNGVVVVWELATGQVKHTLQSDASHGAVTALAFNPQGSLLYASSASDKYVLEWSLSSGQVERKFRVGSGGASALAVSGDGAILAAGSSVLRTFDLASGQKSRKLVSGLSSAVTQLRFAVAGTGELEASRFLFAATAGARFVNMYDLQLTEHDAPALTFSLPSSAESLFARAVTGGTAASKKSKKHKKEKSSETAKPVVDLLVGATTSAGAMFVWVHKYHQAGDASELALASKPLRPLLSTAESAGILLAELSTEADTDLKTQVLVARGSVVKPVFEKVSLVEEDAPSQWKKKLEFAEISDALLLSAERAEVAAANGSIKRQKVAAAHEDEKTHVPTLSERRALANSMTVVDETISFEERPDGDAEEEENELTLAERVEALREHIEGDVTAALSRAERESETPDSKALDNKPDASSLASVLEQALQARDNALLEYCLRLRDAKIIGRTVARVSPSRVLALLEVIVHKLERSPNRFSRLCVWLRAVLLHHTAYLVAQPDLVSSLSALYQLLETRLQVHEQMQKLSGRLALVLGQIQVNTNVTAEQEDDETRAAVVYHEGEEEVSGDANGDDGSSQEQEDEDEDEDEGIETEDE